MPSAPLRNSNEGAPNSWGLSHLDSHSFVNSIVTSVDLSILAKGDAKALNSS